jgi:hypothetical protein
MPNPKALYAGMSVAILMSVSLPAQAQFTDLLRGISGAIRGEQAPQQQQGLTPTIGVRGIEEGGVATAGGVSTADFALVESWAVSDEAASKAAKQRKLVARTVQLRSGPILTPAPTPSSAPASAPATTAAPTASSAEPPKEAP